MDSIPTPPNEDHPKSQGPKRHSSSSKSVKAVHRGAKRANNAHGHAHPHPHPPSPSQESHSGHAMADSRHKRVWKACERCRMKKTKCDGEFPCKRCKDDGLVCTAGTRKKTEYKQLPRGYAEVLENTQFALIATVHKLYSMVRNQQAWDLGEPELNDRGQPVIHNIASKLGCIRPNSDVDLPVHSVFPEDEAGLAELARQLEEQQQKEVGSGGGSISAMISIKHETESLGGGSSDRASSSEELDHSDFEQDYRRSAFTGRNAVTMSPQSLTYNEFDVAPPTTTAATSASSESFAAAAAAAVVAASVSGQSPIVPSAYPSWMSRPSSLDFGGAGGNSGGPAPPYVSSSASYMNMDMLNQGLLESSFGTIKPHVLSCPNPEVMMGMGDPMIYAGYDPEALRL